MIIGRQIRNHQIELLVEVAGLPERNSVQMRHANEEQG